MIRNKTFCTKIVSTNGIALNHDKSLQIYLFCVKHQAKIDYSIVVSHKRYTSKQQIVYTKIRRRKRRRLIRVYTICIKYRNFYKTW